MHAAMHKGRRRPDICLFVATADALEGLSGAPRSALGALGHIMDLVPTPARRLVRGEARSVLRALLQRGCHLPLPAADERLPLARGPSARRH